MNEIPIKNVLCFRSPYIVLILWDKHVTCVEWWNIIREITKIYLSFKQADLCQNPVVGKGLMQQAKLCNINAYNKVLGVNQ